MMLRQCSRFLLPPTYRPSFRSFRVASNKKEQAAYLEKNLPPELFKLLMETKTTDKYWMKVMEMNVFEKIQTYKADYTEKSVLLDESVADRISHSVLTHTRGDKTTTFFDGEGGLCHIATKVKSFDVFKEVCVLEKDLEGLVSLNGFARDPSIPVYDVNLSKDSALSNQNKQTYVPDLLKYLPTGNRDEEVPSFTIVTSAPQSLVKYFTHRMLFRDNPLGELYSSRPEFFLILTARSYFHICCGLNSAEPHQVRVSEEVMRELNSKAEKQGKLTLHYNVLFQILCDFCLVEILPRRAFFPWRKHKRHNQPKGTQGKPQFLQRSQDQYYENQHERLMMVYVRPKKHEGLGIGNPIYLDYFVAQVIRNKSKRVVQLFEEWSTGWGFLLLEAGYSILSEVKDLEVDDIMPLYKMLIAVPDFEHSNFVVEALDYHSAAYEAGVFSEEAMEEFRVDYKRMLKIGEDYFETES